MSSERDYRDTCTPCQESSSRTPSQRSKILSLLGARGPAGATNVELNAIAFRYGGRIFELRRLGHEIRTENLGGGLFRFVLVRESSVPKPLTSYQERNGHLENESMPLFGGMD